MFDIKNNKNNNKIIVYFKIIALIYIVAIIVVTLVTKKPNEYLDSILYELRPLILIILIYSFSHDYFDNLLGIKKDK